MKNLKVHMKFIVSFGIILLLFLISLISSSIGTSSSKSNYQQFFEEDYEAVVKIDDIQYRLQAALKELMLGSAEPNLDDAVSKDRERGSAYDHDPVKSSVAVHRV